jgi:predicted  nucleic acid-binding Zn-ribbon protein
METQNYTYEKFKEDFEDAQTPEAKQEALITLLDSDIDVKEYKEDIQEYRAQLQDLKDQIDGVIDASINTGIENGTFELYTCTEDVDQYKAERNYYVKVDEIKKRYTETIAGGEVFVKDLDPKIQEYIAGLKDLIWIVTDEGIGTLKKKNLVVDFDFSKHFTIFV